MIHSATDFWKVTNGIGLIVFAVLLLGCSNHRVANDALGPPTAVCSDAPCPDPVSRGDVNYETFGTMSPNGGPNNYNLLKDNADCYGLTGIMAVKPFQGPYGPVPVGSVAVFPGELASGKVTRCKDPVWKGSYPAIEGETSPPFQFRDVPTNHQQLIEAVGGKPEYFIGFSVRYTANGPIEGVRSCTCNPQWFDKDCEGRSCNCALGCCDGVDWGLFVRKHVVPGVVTAP